MPPSAAGQAIASFPEEDRGNAMFLLVILIGVYLAVFGLLRMGRLIRFVSHAVMTGFLIGVAVVIAVQGAGVSQSMENLDDSPIDPSRDMFAQGAANIASGMFSGIPAGGSVGQTALNVSVGRLSGIFAGLSMLVIVLFVPELIGQVPMAVLAALLIQG